MAEVMLDALGNIGDFLGGIGVVITLIYLAAISDWTREAGTSPESSGRWEAGSREFDALSPKKRVRFNIHFQFTHGAIDESAWAGWANRTHSILEPAGVQVWWRAQQAAYSPEFRRFVEEEEASDDLPESIVRRSGPAVL